MSKKYTTNFLEDTNGSTGSANQVLVSTAAGIDWVDGSGTGIIGGPYLPLSAGVSYPLTGVLFGTGGYFTGNLGTEGVLTIQAGNPYIQWNNAAGTRLGYIQHSTNLVMNADSGKIVLNTAANNDILINPNGTGKVGIGTTNPQAKLHILNSAVGGNYYGQLVVEHAGEAAIQLKGTSFSSIYFSDTAAPYQAGIVYNHSTNSLELRGSGNTDDLTITSAGNVGIGTDIPGEKLHVVGNTFLSANSAYMASYNNTNSYHGSLLWAGLQLGNNGVNRIVAGRTGVGGSFQFWTNNTNNAADYTVTPDGVMAMSILNNGNVGIGTTSPGAKLQVGTRGTAGALTPPTTDGILFDFHNDGSPYTRHAAIISQAGDASESVIDFWTKEASGTNSKKMTLRGDGNVGIGTTSPTFKLHVNSTDASDNVAYIHHNNAAQSSGDVLKVRSDAGDNAGSALLNVANNTGTALYVRGDRNVGIGTTSPNRKLVIDGEVGIQDANKMFFGNTLNNPSYIKATWADNNNTGMQFHTFTASVDLPTLTLDPYGKVGIGTTSNSAEDTNNGVPKLQVTTATAVLGEFPLAARFTTASDAGDDSGVSVLINSGNDRGLMISAGRQTGNVSKVTLNVVKNDGDEIDTITLLQNGASGSTANVGIGTTNPAKQLQLRGSAPFIRLEEDSASNKRLDLWVDPSSAIAYVGANQSAQQLSFQTGNSDRIRILNNGNVGIGTTSPGSKLEVKTSGFNTTIELDNSDTQYSVIQHNALGALKGFTGYNSGFMIYGGESGVTTRLQAGGAYAATILTNGNFGIGTTSPNVGRLEVGGASPTLAINSSTNTDPTLFLLRNGGANGIGLLKVRDGGHLSFDTGATGAAQSEKMRITSAGGISFGSTGTAYGTSGQVLTSAGNASPTWTTPSSGGGIGGSIAATQLAFGSATANEITGESALVYSNLNGLTIGTGGVSSSNSILNLNKGASGQCRIQMKSAGNTAFDIKLDSSEDAYITADNALTLTSGNSEHIILSPAGNVGIGTTSPTSYKLDVTGTGRFTSTVTATNFILSSDKRLKDNIKNIDNNHIDVDWKNFELKSEPGIKRSGVIAQELEEKHPEFVRTDKEGLKSVAYIDLLIAKIAELEARLEKAGI